MPDKNPYEGLELKPDQPEQFHKEPNPFEGLGLGEKVQPPEEHGAKRFGSDVLSLLTGVAKFGQNTLGSIGDVHSYLNLPPPKSTVMMPTTQDVGEFTGKLASKFGLPSELPKPTTPEGKFFEPMAQTAASMMSMRPWALGGGATAGAFGEIASRIFDNGETPAGEKSGARTLGELAVLLPALGINARSPVPVKMLKPSLDRIGSEGEAAYKISKADAMAQLAAERMQMPHASLWSQMPELYPAIKDIRSSKFGGPLNEQARLESLSAGETLNQPFSTATVPSLAHGYLDPLETLGNVYRAGQATSPRVPRTNVVEQGRTTPISTWFKENVNFTRWPGMASEWLNAKANEGAIKGLVKSLTGPNSKSELNKIATYSHPEHIAEQLVKALLGLQGASGEASSEANTIPLPSMPSGIKVQIGKVD
jgi:hypothetical protein